MRSPKQQPKVQTESEEGKVKEKEKEKKKRGKRGEEVWKETVRRRKRENIEENTVDNTEEVQEDNNAIKQMRERIKELEGVEKEYKTVQMDTAIKDAGFDPSSGQGKALKDLYKGDLDVDAIKAFAAEQYGWGEEAPAVQEQEAQKSSVVTSQDLSLIHI